MSKIGIGIVTYNRLACTQRVVSGIRENTISEYELVVADDGSDDGTAEWCRANDIRVVSGKNGGVCWNKNRALFALQELGCDPILLLEDDCIPVRPDWDWDWRIATALYGHVAFAHPKLAPWLISGTGTPVDPFVNNKATAQCSSASGLALSQVGFFDTRFKGYGVGHAEWTTRMKRVGYGFRKAIDREGREVKANLYIVGGLIGDDAPTFKDKANIARNEALFAELKKEPPYRDPWSNDEERERFLSEQKKAGIGSSRYQALNASEEDRDARLNARHLRSYGRAFRRTFGEAASFIRSSDWLSSIALDLPLYRDEITPPLNYPMIDFISSRVRPHHVVLDIAGGVTAIWWSRRVATVNIIDNDSVSRDRLRSIWPEDGAQINQQGEGLENEDKHHNSCYDIIVTSGSQENHDLMGHITNLKNDGVLLIANSDHRNFRGVRAKLKEIGFNELDLRGAAPTRVGVEISSIFYRTENCINI